MKNETYTKSFIFDSFFEAIQGSRIHWGTTIKTFGHGLKSNFDGVEGMSGGNAACSANSASDEVFDEVCVSHKMSVVVDV